MTLTDRAPPAPLSTAARGRGGRPVRDLAMSSFARMLTRTFFRQVVVEHGDRIVSGRPTVVVADHRNGLVDGLLLMGALGRYPRFLGKSTLFRNPLLWPFLHLGGVVPIYRTQDGGSPDGNRRAFARCDRLLEGGGVVALFPEGVSHDETDLQPLRTGAARIALSAAAGGVPQVETVAVTLVYDDKQRFRSRALVRVGVPAPTRPWVASYRRDGPATVRALTDDLAGRLRTEAGRYATGGAELAAIAELVVRAGASPPGLTDQGAVVDALVQAGRDPDRSAAVSSLLSDHAAYTRLLDGLGLRDTEVAADDGSGHLRRHLVRSVAGLVAALPLALIGAAVHAVPYAVVKVASGLPTNVGMRATVKVLGSFFLYGLTYGIVGVTVGAWLGAAWGLLAAAAAPVCGWLALRTTERIHELGGVVADDRTVRGAGPLTGTIRAQRAAVVDATRRLLDPGPPPGP